MKNQIFRKRNFIYLILLILLALAVFTHDRQDMSILDGGTQAMIRNWIGPAGATVSAFLFLMLGLAVYPMLLLLSLAAIRNFLPYPLERKWYSTCLLVCTLGIAIWFAMYPAYEPWLMKTEELGIGRNHLDAAASTLSGGVLGQFLAAPGSPEEMFSAGLIRRFIGEIGTLVVVLAMFLPTLLIMLYQDGKGIFTAIREKNPVTAPPPAPAAAATADRKPDDDKPPFDVDDEPPAEQKPAGPKPIGGIRRTLIRWLSGSDLRDEIREEKEAQNAPPAAVPAQDPEDDYRVLPPRDMTPEPQNTPPPLTTIPAEPETLPPQTRRPPAPQRGTAPVNTPVGVQPGIRQFGDQGSDKAPAEPANRFCDDYELPSVKMLDQHSDSKMEDTAHLESGKDRLQKTLDSFSVAGHVENIIVGPRVTRYEVQLDEGVEVGKVTRISQNIAMTMEVPSLRILAPIPGKNAVGVEVPNKNSSIVYIRSVMESGAWTQSKMDIPIVLGRDVEGNAIVTNLAKAPHMLIAGSTGSGKSVCMNTLIMSLLFKFSPDELRLILVDPKVVEMQAYATIPHLITPVVNDPKKVPLALRWGVNEMERRYRIMAKVLSKDLKGFNNRPKSATPVLDDDGSVIPDKLPFLIIIIDELADIMMTEAKKDVETSICRIAQKGRAAGVHLVIATQTPRKDVITGLIKANLPVKIAFKVGTNMDSRVILDQGGAEKLLGMGDLLFMPPGASVLERIQMTLVTDDEIKRIVDFCSGQAPQRFNADVLSDENAEDENGAKGPTAATAADDEWEDDEAISPEIVDSVAAKYLQPGDSDLLRQALELIINERQASTSFFQRRLGIGYNKSAELVDQLERRNIISKPLGGGQKRDILILDGLEISE